MTKYLVEKIDKSDINNLISISLAYRTGRIGHAKFYKHIERLADFAEDHPRESAGKSPRQSAILRKWPQEKHLQFLKFVLNVFVVTKWKKYSKGDMV